MFVFLSKILGFHTNQKQQTKNLQACERHFTNLYFRRKGFIGSAPGGLMMVLLPPNSHSCLTQPWHTAPKHLPSFRQKYLQPEMLTVKMSLPKC
jgi:hypothetical protein